MKNKKLFTAIFSILSILGCNNTPTTPKIENTPLSDTKKLFTLFENTLLEYTADEKTAPNAITDDKTLWYHYSKGIFYSFFNDLNITDEKKKQIRHDIKTLKYSLKWNEENKQKIKEKYQLFIPENFWANCNYFGGLLVLSQDEFMKTFSKEEIAFWWYLALLRNKQMNYYYDGEEIIVTGPDYFFDEDVNKMVENLFKENPKDLIPILEQIIEFDKQRPYNLDRYPNDKIFGLPADKAREKALIYFKSMFQEKAGI